MKKLLIRLALGLLAGVVVLVLGGAMYVDSVLKAGFESSAPKLTKSDVRLDAIGLSLLTGSGRAVGFELGNPVGFQQMAAFRCDTTFLDLQPASLLGSKLVLNHLRMEAAEVNFEGTAAENNLQALLDNVNASLDSDPGDGADDGSGARRFQVNELLISGAKVRVMSTNAGASPLTLTLPDIRLSDLGTTPDGISGGELTRLVLRQIQEQTLVAVATDFTNRLLQPTPVDGTNHLNSPGATDTPPRK